MKFKYLYNFTLFFFDEKHHLIQKISLNLTLEKSYSFDNQ